MLLLAAASGDHATIERATLLATELADGTSSTAARLRNLVRPHIVSGGARSGPKSDGQLVAAAFPERIAGRLGQNPGRYQLTSGVIATMMDDDPLRGTPVIVAVAVDGDRRAGRIFRSVAITAEELTALGVVTAIRRNATLLGSGRIEVHEETLLGSAVLRRKPVAPGPDDVAAAALAGLDLRTLLAEPGVAAIRARVALLHNVDGPGSFWPDWSVERLSQSVGEWLVPALRARDAIDPLRGFDLSSLLVSELPPVLQRKLGLKAPTHVGGPQKTDRKVR